MSKRYYGPFKVRDLNALVVPGLAVDRHDTVTATGGYYRYDTYRGFQPDSFVHLYSLSAPLFKKLVAEGWIILNPFQRVLTTWGYGPGQMTDTYTYGTPNPYWVTNVSGANLVTRYQFPTLFPPVNVNLDADLRSRAGEEALSRAFAKAAGNKADLLVDLLELKGTVKMFIGLLGRLKTLIDNPGAFLDIAKAIARGDGDRLVRIPGMDKPVRISSLSGLWCEMRFGWRPLWGSLQGVVEAINSLDVPETRRITYRATEYYDNTFEESQTHSRIAEGLTGSMRATTNLRSKSTYRAGVLVEEDVSIKGLLGLRASDIPNAVWDLVPLSFIVDRFLNVSNWIRSIVPRADRTILGGWLVERFERTTTWTFEHNAHDLNNGLSGNAYRKWTSSGSKDEVRRTESGTIRVIHDSPPRGPVLRHDWSSLTDWYNLMDAIALAIQLLTKRSP